VLNEVDGSAVQKAREMIRAGRVRVELDGISSAILIRAVLRTEHDNLHRGDPRHTYRPCLLQKNGETLFFRKKRQ
jgi:hypothetical protein